MTYNEESRQKLHASMLKKHGSIENWKAANKVHASKGGQRSSPTKGFAHSTHDPAAAGRTGGLKSKRRKSLVN